ncbi:hypothetical protein ACQEVZ_54925 [Dactylosporangium sp. CA-152071]|uniref:hypothetical protein n=1 Tax=Dactylosporangium sp. CA-152071 TaxID=3239933 RepID=UPI003D947D56
MSTYDFDSTDGTRQLLDAIRDEAGIPRDEWSPADPDAALAALGVHVVDAPEDDYATYERFVVATAPIDVPDSDPELLPAPAVPWLDWARNTLRLPENADVDGPRWFDVAEELAGAAMPPPVALIALPGGRRAAPPPSGASGSIPGLAQAPSGR